MTTLSGIVRQRSAPGALVFDAEGRLLFANEQAQELLATLRSPEADPGTIPEALRVLCREVREGRNAARTLNLACPGVAPGVMPPCSARAMPMEAAGSGTPGSHVLVLLERVVEKHQIDLEKAQRTYHLSKREAEALNLIGLGFTNRKIAEALFISEHTVKDHIKSIMKKLGAGSRAEIVASLR